MFIQVRKSLQDYMIIEYIVKNRRLGIWLPISSKQLNCNVNLEEYAI